MKILVIAVASVVGAIASPAFAAYDRYGNYYDARDQYRPESGPGPFSARGQRHPRRRHAVRGQCGFRPGPAELFVRAPAERPLLGRALLRPISAAKLQKAPGDRRFFHARTAPPTTTARG